jgi:putative transposase
MPYRTTPLVNDQVYHIFNRGVAKMPLFSDKRDYTRFLATIYYYQFQGPKPQFSQLNRFKDFKFENNKKIVEILGYCLMSNHYHFLVKQLQDNGISEFINKISNSYTKFFNTKHNRVGPLLQGQFKAVRIGDDNQLVHVSRYIHLNPVSGFLTKDLNEYVWSSYLSYIGFHTDRIVSRELILSMFQTEQKYEQFVLDQVDYSQSLVLVKHLLIDEED